jgi:ribonuclease HI
METITKKALEYYNTVQDFHDQITYVFIYPGIWSVETDPKVSARLFHELGANPADIWSLLYYDILPVDPEMCTIDDVLKPFKNITERYEIDKFLPVFNDLCRREVFIFTDGACSGNGKSHANASFACTFDDMYFASTVEECAYISASDYIYPDLKSPSVKPSNNRGELLGFIFGLIAAKYLFPLSKKINLFTDSKYTINTVTSFYPTRLKKGTEMELLNPDLLKIAYNLYSEVDINIQYVKAHQKTSACKFCNKCDECFIRHGNEAADRHASNPSTKYKDERVNVFLNRRFGKMYNPVPN